MKNLKDYIINVSEKLKLNKQSISEKDGENVIFFPWGNDFIEITRNKMFRDESKKYVQHSIGEKFSIFIITCDKLKESLIDAKLNISSNDTRVYSIPDSYNIKRLIDDWQTKKITIDDIDKEFNDITAKFKDLA